MRRMSSLAQVREEVRRADGPAALGETVLALGRLRELDPLVAAIAAENLRLSDQLRDAQHELRDAQEQLARADRDGCATRARAELSAALHERHAQLVLEGAALPEVLAAMAEVLGGRLELVDADGALLEVAGAPAAAGASAVAEVPVAEGTLVLGALRLLRERPDAADRELLECGAVLVAALILQLRCRSETEHRLRGQLLEELLGGGRADRAGLVRRAARLGVDLEREHVVVVARVAESATRWSLVLARCSALDEDGLASELEDRIVALVPAADAPAVARRWSATLTSADSRAPTLGAAGPASGVEGLRDAYAEARRTLHVLDALERDGEAATAGQLGLFGLVFGGEEPAGLRGFLDRALGPVLEHDAQRGGALLETLAAFFAEAGQLNNTARALGVHVNTLYQRLERLDEVLGADWRKPDRRLELHLAVRLRALDERIGRAPTTNEEI